MRAEREIITVAFGNYSSLVAAQWANGTSRYDVHHRTLYSECRHADVQGGGDPSSGEGRARVPRLLLLDAPYGATFDDVEAWERKCRERAELSGEEVDDAHDPSGAPSSAYTGNAWSSADVLSSGTPADREATRIAKVALAVQRRIQHHHDLDHDDGEENEERDSGDDDGADAFSWGEDANDHEGSEEEEEEEGKGDGVSMHRSAKLKKGRIAVEQRQAKIKRRLFYEQNSTIPWWQYITTGLAPGSVNSLKPLQQRDAGGDVPALHSFGYGLAHLRDSQSSSEVSELSDALRRQLETSDLLQGIQCFTDGDGIFGGAAANVLQQLWEEAGPKTPVVQVCTFSRTPEFLLDSAQRAGVAFGERRLDEAALNQLLATLHLSRHPSAVYIPVPLSQWDGFFKGAVTATSATESPPWLQDERATAQFLATVIDTALYSLRDGSREQGVTSPGPLCYMDEWCRVVRPAASLRVAAAMGAVPSPVSASSDLWELLQATPLLPDAPTINERGVLSAEEVDGSTADRTCTRPPTRFLPLTHTMSTFSPASTAGQVLGHTVCLRGAGRLPSTVYPPREAMLRYALPLRTSTYLSLVTDVSYPVSSTFPMELLFADPSSMETELGHREAAGDLHAVLSSIDVGAHVLSTYASAPMLLSIYTKAQSALRHKMTRFCDAYVMETDDWREALDEGMCLYDDYHHAAPSDRETGSNDGSDYY